mmetsp:Transcript_52678/g.145670  ORF Transcript_52678/g.145670 Transcript_52678/m.145670 type:complete len:252 (+) Transcript_52678:474-1229(+)
MWATHNTSRHASSQQNVRRALAHTSPNTSRICRPQPWRSSSFISARSPPTQICKALIARHRSPPKARSGRHHIAGLRCRYGRLDGSTFFSCTRGCSWTVTILSGGSFEISAGSSCGLVFWTTAASDLTECLAARPGLDSSSSAARCRASSEAAFLVSPIAVDESQSGCCAVSPAAALFGAAELRTLPRSWASSSPFQPERKASRQSPPASSTARSASSAACATAAIAFSVSIRSRMTDSACRTSRSSMYES